MEFCDVVLRSIPRIQPTERWAMRILLVVDVSA